MQLYTTFKPCLGGKSAEAAAEVTERKVPSRQRERERRKERDVNERERKREREKLREVKVREMGMGSGGEKRGMNTQRKREE